MKSQIERAVMNWHHDLSFQIDYALETPFFWRHVYVGPIVGRKQPVLHW